MKILSKLYVLSILLYVTCIKGDNYIKKKKKKHLILESNRECAEGLYKNEQILYRQLYGMYNNVGNTQFCIFSEYNSHTLKISCPEMLINLL